MTEEEQFDFKFKRMTQTPMSSLIPTLAIPTIISMLVTSIYNMVDTYFVSQIGRSASGAVSIIFSLMAVIQTIGFAFSMGSSTTISKLLGQKRNQYAKEVLSTGFFTAFIAGVTVTIFGLCFLDKLVFFLGATETIAPLAKEYAFYILISTPFMTTSFVMNACLRAQGNAFYSMIGLTTGAILNMIFDPILIFYFDLGITGAGLSTAGSQVVSFCVLFYQCNGSKKSMSISTADFKPSFKTLKTILKAGLPNFYRQGLGSVASILTNLVVRPYGDAAIAAFGIVSRILMFINSALIGFGQGFQPVSGYNYGAKRYDRTLEAFWFTFKVAVVGMTILSVLGGVFAEDIVRLFRKEDLEVIEIATLALRLNCLTLPLQSWIIVSNMLAQSIGYSFRASLIAMSRQGIFFIPLLLLLPLKFQLFGVQIAQPLSEVMSLLFSIWISSTIIKDLKRLKNQ